MEKIINFLMNVWDFLYDIDNLGMFLLGVIGFFGLLGWAIVKVITWAIIEIFDPVWGYDICFRGRIRAEREKIKEEKKRKKAEAKYWAEIEKKYR